MKTEGLQHFSNPTTLTTLRLIALSLLTMISSMQVLQLQSAASVEQSQEVDYESGIEAMVLAILQQTNYSQQVELAAVSNLSMVAEQAYWVRDGVLIAAYDDYLNAALAANSNLTLDVESGLLNISQPSSILPVSRFVAFVKAELCYTCLMLNLPSIH